MRCRSSCSAFLAYLFSLSIVVRSGVMTSIRKLSRPWTLAIAVLLVGAVAVVAFAQQSPEEENPVVIAQGNDVMRLDELNARFEIAIRSLAANQGVPLSDDIRAELAPYLPQYLEQLATERVLLAEAERRSIPVPQDEVEATVERLRANIPEGETFESLLEGAGFESEAQLRTLVVESQRIEAVLESIRENIHITDEQLKVAYQNRREEFRTPEQVCARHILLETEEDANEVLTELEQGADFAELAQERSTGPSGPQGGDLGCLGRGQTVAPFDEAAFSAPVGEPVGPVETQFGQHVILVYELRDAGLTPLDEVRDQLRQQIVQERTDRMVAALIETASIRTFPERLPEPPAPEPAEGMAPADIEDPEVQPVDPAGDDAN